MNLSVNAGDARDAGLIPGSGRSPGVGDGQRGLECCGSWGCKQSDTTELMN